MFAGDVLEEFEERVADDAIGPLGIWVNVMVPPERFVVVTACWPG